MPSRKLNPDYLRVLVVADWASGGGVQSVMEDLAEELTGKVRYDAFFFNRHDGCSPWSEFCGRVFYHSQMTLTELLVKERFDVVHLIDTACPPPYDANRWLRRARYRGAVVCSFHVCDANVPQDQIADVFVACSAASAHSAEKSVGRPVKVIWNGVNDRRFFPMLIQTPQRPILAWAGRAHDLRKNFDGFEHIATSLIESDFEFWVASPAGVPGESQFQEKFGQRMKVVRGLDRRQMPEFYSAVGASRGALISTSISESFQLTLLEAAACGCPIIAPAVAWTSYLEPGKSALLYSPENPTDHLRDCVRVLRDPRERAKLVEGARALIRENFNSRRMAEEYYNTYSQAIRIAESSTSRRWRDSAMSRANSVALRGRRILRRLGTGTSI